MGSRRSTILLAALLLIVSPLLAHRWFVTRDSYYDEVASMYECERDVCEADFDGDGILGRLERRTNIPATPSKRLLVVIDNGRELLRLPYRYIDGTLRTHVAIRNESGRARLLIFDGVERAGIPVRAVFAWDGQSMAQLTPSDDDHEILSAMSARDDAGTWSDWALYRAFSLPLLFGYYLLLAGIMIGFTLRHRLWSGKSHPR